MTVVASLPRIAFPRPGFDLGGLEVVSRALMAPMMGYNEAPLRQICREFGSGLAVTEMIKPEKLARGDPDVLRDLVFSDDERPLGAQVAVREAGELVPALQELEGRGFDFLDLNLGCPLKKECNKGWGAALLRDPDKVARLVDAAVQAVSCPLTVKVRAGYELGELVAPEVVRLAVAAGAAMICVHGRTKMGWYREPNNLGAIRAVVEAVDGRVPVVGNGDVVDLESAVRMFSETGCDAVMIGRGAVGNPWVFRQVNAYLERGEVVPSPTLSEVRALFARHMRLVQAVYGVRKGFSQVKRYAFHYFGPFGLENAWRARIASTRSTEQLDEVLDGIERAVAERGPGA